MAYELDVFTQTVLDKSMCTEICPCYHEGTHEETVDGGDGTRTDAKVVYDELGQRLYAFERRASDDLAHPEYAPLHWSTDRDKAFDTFLACLVSWEYKASVDESINLQ